VLSTAPNHLCDRHLDTGFDNPIFFNLILLRLFRVREKAEILAQEAGDGIPHLHELQRVEPAVRELSRKF
jgi:hypothetical protein